MTVEGWSSDPAQNAIQGNIDFSENMKPAKVNDSMRQLMADVAVWRDKLVTTTALYSTLTDDLTLFQDPTAAMHAATKQYVDAGDATLQTAVTELQNFRTSLMAGSQASMDTFLEAYNEFQATDDAIVVLNNLVATKAASNHNHDAVYLGKTGTAANASRLGNQLPEYYAPASAATGNEAITVTDWNDVRNNGVFRGQGAANAPGSDWFMGHVFRHNGNWVTQCVWDFSSNRRVYYRYCTNGIWSAWTQVSGTNFKVWHPDNLDPSSLGAPAGTIIAFAANTTPSGYLSCYGQLVNRTTYADLFSVLGTRYGAGDGSTTFNLPDLRGEFLRGWDNSRGVDSGRAIGTWQNGDIQGHIHSYDTSSSDSGATGGTWPANKPLARGGTNTQTEGAVSNPTGGAETRPRNVAVHYCIKY